jgi:catechol 2,3-dioxygenase-like lactoylglutathione lyase family enzyme
MNLNQVTLPSRDLSVSVPFYRRLGLIHIVDSPPDYARFLCPVGGATLSLQRVDAVGSGERPVVYFECVALDATVAELKRQGVRFDADPEDKPWLWRQAYLRDPDDNVLCLYYAEDNRVNPPWRLAGSR